MAINVAADPISVTATALGVYSFNVVADPITLSLTQKMGILSHTPAADRNPELDQVLDASSYDASGTYELYIPEITVTLTGSWFNQSIVADPITITLSLPVECVIGEIWSDDPIDIIFDVADPQIVTETLHKNWVRWSNIGELDFTIWKDNIAGERPLDYNGWVYCLKKLGNKVIAYGQNGVSALVPVGNTYGLQSVYRLGLKGKHAVCGTDAEHYFVDVTGQLWRLADNIEKLDYSEFLSNLASTAVLSYDQENGLIYLCDGGTGYVYSPSDKSLGEGPINITGIGSQSGTLYTAAASTISTPTFEICTDIFDFGTRKAKTIHNVQIGTDLTSTLSVAVDCRRDKSSTFETIPWREVNDDGVVHTTCYGNEFRFRIKSSSYEYFEIDYVTINGVINDS